MSQGHRAAAEPSISVDVVRRQLDHLGTSRLITGSGRTTLANHDDYPFGMGA